ncbi:flagellar motor protein MotB [Paenibacillus xerothermodurans]|uniref:Flagellar motor protein MotB n=1 Tax=Paenibacillus xerothermodurans TaxID=1977292 RepID=A0A2W1N485_PAEXE|nr:flagellar motor protein MotB [Paenibacillus xerothermodurans]PZE19569.1 flagellar motor protein MotB [Paenibacillus xerothermodurans]
MSKHKKEHHEEHVDESWLIPYADLLTLLLALFIILFAMSNMDAKKYDILMHSLNSAFTGGTGQFQVSNVVPMNIAPNVDSKKYDAPATHAPEQQAMAAQLHKEERELEELKKQLDAYIEQNQLTTQLDTKLTHDRLMVTIRDRALFESGSAALKDESRKLALAISDMLAQYPGYEVQVAGFTDNVPITNGEFSDNWELSSTRAVNFMRLLLANQSVDPSLFSSTGYGEYHALESNDTAEGRAVNRRVEVSVIRNVKPAAGGA